MPQLYIIALVIGYILTKFKELTEGFSLSENAKKYLKFALIAGGLYTLFKIISRTVNKQNALADTNGAIAVELHNAIYAQATDISIWLVGDYIFGNSDEAAILAISKRITNYPEVAKFYKQLYGYDLYVHLESCLNSDELAEFNANIAAKSATGTAPNAESGGKVGTSNTPSNVPKTSLLAVGTPIYCNTASNVNIRSANDPTKILYTANNATTYNLPPSYLKPKGYLGDFVKRRVEKINGKTYNCLEIDIPYEKQVYNYGLNGLVVESYATVNVPK